MRFRRLFSLLVVIAMTFGAKALLADRDEPVPEREWVGRAISGLLVLGGLTVGVIVSLYFGFRTRKPTAPNTRVSDDMVQRTDELIV